MRTAAWRQAPSVLGLASLLAVHGAEAQKLPKVKEINGERVHRVVGRDAIPSIDKPSFVPAAKAKFLRDSEPVIGVIHNGVAKAYSVWHLDGHEIVNDSFGSDAVAVTW